MAQPSAIFFSPDGTRPSGIVATWLAQRRLTPVEVCEADELMGLALRGRPLLAIFQATSSTNDVLAACRRLKADSFTGVVPAVVIVTGEEAALPTAFDSGADEVLRADTPPVEALARLDSALRRAERDLQVHPSTRLPGAPEIERHIQADIDRDERFAVCYADLDHFKEYNDRYSYYEGDRVIRMLAMILHDVVKGMCGEHGFVGHIGGDDFLFIVPTDQCGEVCDEIIAVFDLLVPLQYSEQDRLAGYYFGKDRRGHLHKVPLMTLSIGVVTNERRRLMHAAQVSELATEMKSYAKTLPGSVWVSDRRHDPVSEHPTPVPRQDPLRVGERE